MRKLFALVLLLGLGCFSSMKNGTVTAGADSFSGKQAVTWEGWFTSDVKEGGQILADQLAGTGQEAKDVDVKISFPGSTATTAKIVITFSIISSQNQTLVNADAIAYHHKGCQQIEVKASDEASPALPATWSGQVVAGGPEETITADVSTNYLLAVKQTGHLQIRACGKTVIASTEKQTGSLKEFGEKANLPVSATQTPAASQPASLPAK